MPKAVLFLEDCQFEFLGKQNLENLTCLKHMGVDA